MDTKNNGYEQKLIELIQRTSSLSHAFAVMKNSDFNEWYIGAGAIAQLVWNEAHGFLVDAHIKDIDIAYFDPSNLSKETEKERERELAALIGGDLSIDAKNQARVHEWYTARFAYAITPYQSLEDAIDTWPTTATAIGVRFCKTGEWRVYAPYGLDDLFLLTVRANKKQITESIYEAKHTQWLAHWPKLTVVPW